MIGADRKAGALCAVVGWGLSVFVLLAIPGQVRCTEHSRNDGRTDAMASALDVLTRQLREGSPQLREASFEALSHYYCGSGSASQECVRLVDEGMRNSDWKVRLLNLPNAFLRGIPQPLARKIAIGALRDGRQPLRRALAKLLAQHPEPWARGIVEGLARSPDPIVRVHAAASLVWLGEETYVRVLNKAMDSKNPAVALEAAGHLIALHTGAEGRARIKMVELLHDQDEVVRANVVYCLSELKQDKWSLGLIEHSLGDDSPLVRIAVITSTPRLRLSKSEAVSFLWLITRRWPKERVLAVRIDMLDTVERLERQGLLPREAAARFVDTAVNQSGQSAIGVMAMGILSYPDRREYVKRLLTVAETREVDSTIRLFALTELGRSRDPEITGSLFKLMERQSAEPDSTALRVGCALAIVRQHDGGHLPLTKARAAAESKSKFRSSGT